MARRAPDYQIRSIGKPDPRLALQLWEIVRPHVKAIHNTEPESEALPRAEIIPLFDSAPDQRDPSQ